MNESGVYHPPPERSRAGLIPREFVWVILLALTLVAGADSTAMPGPAPW
jgi:hypothetical protein